jgi:release factor glutamine methyltransferase
VEPIETVKGVKEALEQSRIEDSYREAELIVSHALGMDRATLYRGNSPIPDDIALKIEEIVRRRVTREPLQYIFGSVDFMGLKIKVGHGVLIPRPETELLAEEAIKIFRERDTNPPFPPFAKRGQGGITESEQSPTVLRFLDLCTGSGCLALALARAFPDALVYGIDSEETALRFAEENAKTNTIKNVRFLKGSLFEPIEKRIALTEDRLFFDLIVSNPPYIRRDDLNKLQPEIKNWEPLSALDGGEDGLNFYREIISGARKYLTANGLLLFELGIHQADAVKQMAEDEGFQDITVRKDYAGIERIFIAWA